MGDLVTGPGTALEPAADVPLPTPFPRPRPRDTSPYWVYLAHFDGKESERTMRGCLDRLAVMLVPALEPEDYPGELIPWESMRRPHAVMIRKRLIERGWSPSHINKHLCALRGVTTECWQLELMGADDLARIKSVKQVTATRLLTGRNIQPDEFAAILTACLATPGPLGIRDAAMVALLHSTGLRRDEVAAAMIEQYDAGERALKIIGKGNKERLVFLHHDAVRYLDRWIVTVGARRGPIFRPVDKHGNVGSSPLAARTVGRAIDRRHNEAKVKPTSTHDFRRTFIGDFIDAGGDLVQAQQLAGHASATTTARYDRRPDRQRRAAVDRLHLPSPEELSPR